MKPGIEIGEGPRLLTKSAYAKHRDVSPSLVTYWHKAGRIKLTPDGRFVDVEASDRMLAGALAPDRGGRNGDGSRTPAPPTEALVNHLSDDRARYGQVRIARESVRATREHNQYRQEIGELVEKTRYDTALADGLGPILSKIDSLPSRVVPQVAEPDAHRVHALIKREVAEIRHEIAQAMRALIESHAGKTRH